MGPPRPRLFGMVPIVNRIGTKAGVVYEFSPWQFSGADYAAPSRHGEYSRFSCVEGGAITKRFAWSPPPLAKRRP